MKKLCLSRKQARNLANDLLEYHMFRDSSNREMFKGFVVEFDDKMVNEVCSDKTIRMTPITDFVEIDGEDVLDNN